MHKYSIEVMLYTVYTYINIFLQILKDTHFVLIEK